MFDKFKLFATERRALIFSLMVGVIFLTAFVLRLGPATLNHFANDNHYQVIQKMQSGNGQYPNRDDCLQCYHPQLYYQITYATIEFVGRDKLTSTQQEQVGQYWNVAAAMATLVIIWIFLRKLPILPIVQILTFALIALNPRLIAINVQMTNDSFVILFSTAAFYFLWRYIQRQKFVWLVTVAVFTGLALITKGSGLVVGVLVLLSLLAVWVISILRKTNSFQKALRDIGVFLLIVVSMAVAFGPYYADYKSTGSPFAINRDKSPPAKMFARTMIEKKTGVISLYDAYGTFRIVGLLKFPYLGRAEKIRESTLPRTSLWTNLYARWHWLHYERHPKKWKTKDWPMIELARGLYLLGLVPLGVFILGLGVCLRKFFAQIAGGWRKIANGEEWFYLAGVAFFALFIMKLTYDYRSFVTMKVIYILPALLILTAVFAQGFDTLWKWLSNRQGIWQTWSKILRKLISIALISLLILYIAQVLILWDTLSKLVV